jgi:8-oxo-dGTP diphosphatase
MVPMGISAYLADLRRRVGTDLLLVPAVAALVRDGAGAVLLQRRADDGNWELPGGALDPGETPAQALVREVYEEAGVVVRPVGIAAVWGGPEERRRYPNGDLAEYTTTIFHAEIVRGAPRPLDGEATCVRFVPVAEAPPRIAALLAGPTFRWDEAWLSVDNAHGRP